MSTRISDQVLVALDTTGTRLEIECPFALNDVVRGMPNRRFKPKTKTWVAPPIRANARYLLEEYPHQHHLLITPDAKKKLEEALARKTWAKNDFPGWYKFAGPHPMPHQLEALNKLYRSESIALLMEQGTSKSKIVIDIAACSRIEGVIGSLVVITPLALRKNFFRELQKHCPIPFDGHFLDNEKKLVEWMGTRPDFPVLFVGIESLSQGRAHELVTKFLTCASKPMLVVDESTTIKNPTSIRTKRVWDFRNLTVKRAILNGTPITKGLMDLFAQFEFLNPDILGLGDWMSFRNRYAVMGGYENKQIIGYTNVDELLDLIEPYTYQKLKTEVLHDLPPKLGPFEITVELTAEQRAIYKQINSKKTISVPGELDYVIQNSLEKALRLQQVCGGFLPQPDGKGGFSVVPIPGKNAKLAALLDFLETRSPDESTIIWTPYKHELALICGALRDKYGADQVVELHGDVDEDQRDVNVYEIFEKKKARFLVGNPYVGGAGLTMIACTLMIYYTNTHNFWVRAQSEDRAHRNGQKNSVEYYDLVCAGTVDEDVVAALSEKLDLAEYFRRQIQLRAHTVGLT